MSKKWIIPVLVVLTAVCGPSFAAKPERPAAVPAPVVYSVKIDYTGGFILVEGADLAPPVSGTIAGVDLSVDPASTSTTLLFPFSAEVAAVVDGLGNYVLTVSTDGGNVALSAFIPFALVVSPPPPPPGLDCPCSPEWDDASTTPSPNGFAGLEPYCSEDTGNWVTVQFSDGPRYWVMWTNWDSGSSSGSCALFIDGPDRTLDTQDQFDACADFLRDIVTVWGDQGNECLL